MFGIGPPLVTPFTETGDIDELALQELVNWMINRGVDFLVPCGSAGEAELMSSEERAQVIEIVVRTAPNHVPVLAGTGHQGLKETKRQTDFAADAGADAALVITPSYYNYDESVYLEYFQNISDMSDIPIYLYTAPSFTGVALKPEMVAQLSKIDNIYGIKDASGELSRVQREIFLSRKKFDIFVGAPWISHALEAGSAGAITSSINVFPKVASEIVELSRNNQEKKARSRNQLLMKVHNEIIVPYGFSGVKAIMREREIPAGYPRQPHKSLDEESLSAIHTIINEA